MAEFNIDRINNIVGEINAGLAKLEKIRNLSKEDFLASPEKVDSAKYNLIVVTEGACDICNHIAAKAGGRSPQSYADCFEILEELGLFPTDFAKKLKQMAKFRNLLVHLYRKVDNSRVFDIIHKDISTVREYLKTINSYIIEHRQDKP
ncbi:MAG: DUF86 domain-containing protein [Candidatus Aminicenantes bacterium]|nr:MAG: DUF86 domain-containing protein [Candidatus Aminicenantes bacterium]